MKNPNLKKFLRVVYGKARTPRGLIVALLASFIMGMGGQKIIRDLSNDKKREKVKAEIEKYLADQPNYNDSIAIVSELYDKEIKELEKQSELAEEVVDWRTDNVVWSLLGLENGLSYHAFAAMKSLKKLSKEQKEYIKKTVERFNGKIDAKRYLPTKYLSDYYTLYKQGKINADVITTFFEQEAKMWNEKLNEISKFIMSNPNNQKTKNLIDGIKIAQAAIDSLSVEKTKKLEQFNDAIKKQNIKNKQFEDFVSSAYAAEHKGKK